MNFRKIALYLVAAVLAASIWNLWVKEHPANSVASAVADVATPVSASNTNTAPQTFQPSENTTVTGDVPVQTPVFQNRVTPAQTIEIKTDVLDLLIDLKSGNIIDASLPTYSVSINDKTPVQLFNAQPNDLYIQETGLTNLKEPLVYTTIGKNFVLGDQQNSLSVTLTAQAPNGLVVQKIFTLNRGSYAVTVTQSILNKGNTTWQGSWYNQIKQLAAQKAAGLTSRNYTGAAISSPEKPYEQLTFKYLSQNNVSRDIPGGWIAMQQHYFLTALIPNQTQVNHYYSQIAPSTVEGKSFYTVGYVSPAVTLAPQKSATQTAVFFVGPELQNQMKPLAKGLDLTVDYGLLSPISEVIFWVLEHVHSVLGNWGWSIVIVTILIKLLFYKLSEKSFKSMAKMREVAPRLKALKERHGSDRQALSQATMEIYRKEKISPLGGCLPMIVQIPVFFALYYVLLESVQLRQADFIFWIHDLSAKDPYYVLPILMGITMFLQQKLTPAAMDSQQAKMMMFLPVIFTVFFATFPSGLVLYWLVNSGVQVIHQWWALKRFEKAKQQQKKTHR